MSDIPPRRIRAQGTAQDPRLMRFILDAPVQAGASGRFDGTAPDVPLAKALFAIDGVAAVQVSRESVLVTRTTSADWAVLKAPVAAAIRGVLADNAAPLGENPAAAIMNDADVAMLGAINEVLETRANPSIAKHGGKITAESVVNGIVSLRMSGGCQGCAASARTLREGVEKMLLAAVPGIRSIVDVTDHDLGTNPFYRDQPGKAPAFFRPVPEGAITLENGRILLDPGFLGPRLGLSTDEVEAGFSRGDITTEHLSGSAPDHLRIAVRSATRAWAAEILPDGSAHEVPPPRRGKSKTTADFARSLHGLFRSKLMRR